MADVFVLDRVPPFYDPEVGEKACAFFADWFRPCRRSGVPESGRPLKRLVGRILVFTWSIE